MKEMGVWQAAPDRGIKRIEVADHSAGCQTRRNACVCAAIGGNKNRRVRQQKADICGLRRAAAYKSNPPRRLNIAVFQPKLSSTAVPNATILTRKNLAISIDTFLFSDARLVNTLLKNGRKRSRR